MMAVAYPRDAETQMEVFGVEPLLASEPTYFRNPPLETVGNRDIPGPYHYSNPNDSHELVDDLTWNEFFTLEHLGERAQ
jgi:hypothetical protein